MELNMIFFGKKGISASSANYVCNYAKDLIKTDEIELAEMAFVDTEESSKEILNKIVVGLGYTKADLEKIPSRLKRLVRFKRLMAWLREALKERDAYYNYVAKEISEKELLEAIGEKKLTKPVHPGEYTEAEHIAGLSREERTRIYDLQTVAAVYGKCVHENGYFTKARKQLLEASRHPGQFVKVDYSGLIARSYTPTIGQEDVDTMYFKIVEIQRDAQKELNTKMHGILEKVRYENIRRDEEHAVALDNYRLACAAQNKRIEAWRKRELHRVANLKIVIPDRLQSIYEEVQRLKVDE